MIKNITIAVLEPDQFIVQGIQYLLLSYFRTKGVIPHFVEEGEAAHADLVILPKYKSLPLMLCQCHPSGSTVPVYITINDIRSGRLRGAPCHLILGSIERRARPLELLAVIVQSLQVRNNQGPVSADTCPQCMTQVLTAREREVVRGMAWGISQKCLPQYLHISPKTVSTHKRTAMRKLGFRRNAELYHWLRLGGLQQTER